MIDTEHNPINAALIPFKAQLLRLEAAKRWGVDLSGMMKDERRLLCLFGQMVKGTLKRPESWTQRDIRQVYNPYVDQWESFFTLWLDSVNSDRLTALGEIGVEVCEVENPFESLLLDLFALVYGPESRDEISAFLWENKSMVYTYKDGSKKDLRKPRDWGLYFKESYDKPAYRICNH